MAKFLIEARYSPEGAKGLVREGASSRRAAVAKMLEAMGCKMESFYFAFGDADVYAIFDAPDNVTAAAMTLAINQSGAVALKTVVLIAPEDMDKAIKKSNEGQYRPPGR